MSGGRPNPKAKTEAESPSLVSIRKLELVNGKDLRRFLIVGVSIRCLKPEARGLELGEAPQPPIALDSISLATAIMAQNTLAMIA